MMASSIKKLYVSNLLTGLVFWYGIEKLFMRSIGINAIGVGVAAAAFLTFSLIFDVPAGILADRWSRKGVLIISAIGLAVGSILMGSSHGLQFYLVGELFYGIYFVCTSGTFSAMIYDTLHEEAMDNQYSRIAGRAYALFLAGVGTATVASGFLAQSYGYRFTYYISAASSLLNIVLISTIREPKFHKAEKKERIFHQLSMVSRALSGNKLVRTLVFISVALSVSDLFKSEFGQLYMLRYFTSPEIIGLLWATYTFTWSFGSLIAHRFRTKINALIFCTIVPYVIMSFIDNWFSLVLFMFQTTAAAAFANQTETRIQENTPSAVRTSIMSVVATLSRAVSVPASFVLGWLFRDYNALVALRFVAVISGTALLFWLLTVRTLKPVSKAPTSQA
jgi:MFS family permease